MFTTASSFSSDETVVSTPSFFATSCTLSKVCWLSVMAEASPTKYAVTVLVRFGMRLTSLAIGITRALRRKTPYCSRRLMSSFSNSSGTRNPPALFTPSVCPLVRIREMPWFLQCAVDGPWPIAARHQVPNFHAASLLLRCLTPP